MNITKHPHFPVQETYGPSYIKGLT